MGTSPSKESRQQNGEGAPSNARRSGRRAPPASPASLSPIQPPRSRPNSRNARGVTFANGDGAAQPPDSPAVVWSPQLAHNLDTTLNTLLNELNVQLSENQYERIRSKLSDSLTDEDVLQQSPLKQLSLSPGNSSFDDKSSPIRKVDSSLSGGSSIERPNRNSNSRQHTPQRVQEEARHLAEENANVQAILDQKQEILGLMEQKLEQTLEKVTEEEKKLQEIEEKKNDMEALIKDYEQLKLQLEFEIDSLLGEKEQAEAQVQLIKDKLVSVCYTTAIPPWEWSANSRKDTCP